MLLLPQTNQQEYVVPAEQTLHFLKRMKELRGVQPIPSVKIVSVDKYRPWAKILADGFLLLDYHVLMNESGTDHTFAARTTHDKIIIRCREGSFFNSTLMVQLTGFFPVSVESQPFPTASPIDYIQIEVGGAP
jgi:hypothetical protein